jgi:hypothetical protein
MTLRPNSQRSEDRGRHPFAVPGVPCGRRHRSTRRSAQASPDVKKHNRPSVFGVQSPSRGSRKTKIDWTHIENYRKGVWVIVVAVAGGYPRGWDRVYSDCRQKFEP